MRFREWVAEADALEVGRALAWVCAGMLVVLFVIAGVMAAVSGSVGAGLLALLAFVPTLCACSLAARWDVFVEVLFGAASSSSADPPEQDLGASPSSPRRTLDD